MTRRRPPRGWAPAGWRETLGNAAALLLGCRVESRRGYVIVDVRLRRRNRRAVDRPAIGCLGVAHHRASRRHEVGLVVEVMVLVRAAPIAAPSLETLRQAAHGLAEDARLSTRIALPEQCELALREAERSRECAHAASKEHEPGDEPCPPRIDESEAAGGDLQHHAAERAAETMMQRPTRWHGQ